MWKLEASERMVRWREFRKSIESLPLENALDSLAKIWHTCPFVPYYLDPDNISSWPDPWTLIQENTYCDLAKALGIVYTITLTNHRPNLEPEIHIYENTSTRLRYNLAVFQQGKYILNLIDSEVVNIEQVNKNLKLQQKYFASDLKLEQY